MKNLRALSLPQRYNYVASFLTFECTVGCSYCINLHSASRRARKKLMTGKEWVGALDRFILPPDTPVTLQGGEPSQHPDFVWIINNIRKDINIDILTNLLFDVDAFIGAVDPARLRRNAPYASIRVSYHPDYMDFGKLLPKVAAMQRAGFSIGIFSILIPGKESHLDAVKSQCVQAGIDFRLKELLGVHEGRMYGTFRYPDAVSNPVLKRCRCRTSEVIIGPDGGVYRCHHDLYKDFQPIGHILDPEFIIEDRFRECSSFGDCNPCDVKVKTNRFQIHGHTSVEIEDIAQI